MHGTADSAGTYISVTCGLGCDFLCVALPFGRDTNISFLWYGSRLIRVLLHLLESRVVKWAWRRLHWIESAQNVLRMDSNEHLWKTCKGFAFSEHTVAIIPDQTNSALGMSLWEMSTVFQKLTSTINRRIPITQTPLRGKDRHAIKHVRHNNQSEPKLRVLQFKNYKQIQNCLRSERFLLKSKKDGYKSKAYTHQSDCVPATFQPRADVFHNTTSLKSRSQYTKFRRFCSANGCQICSLWCSKQHSRQTQSSSCIQDSDHLSGSRSQPFL